MKAEIVGGMITDAAQTDVIDGHAIRALTCTFICDIVFLPTITIDTAPDKHVKIKETLAEDGIGLDLTIIAGCDLRLKAIHVGTLFGDDINHACQSHTAIKRRSRASQHLYLFHLL